MRISDEITAYILHIMEQAENGTAELQRNVLAEELGCVPSQITYVLSSRFTPAHGYLVESRRGGGGYIRIRRVTPREQMPPLMHVVNSIGDELVPAAAEAILQSMVYQGFVSQRAAGVMAAALSDRCYREIPPELRDRLRASLLKQMLTAYTM
ncbi:MAG: CtsR family transcriptional regulator [Clostridia bacterium]|nr:CtsR family transcriptional regulator [Clostridia bacterium]